VPFSPEISTAGNHIISKSSV